MNFEFKERMSKKIFEQMLITLVKEKSGKDPYKFVYSSKHIERDGTIVHLYYWKSGGDNAHALDPHIGSWCKGEGWAYKFDGKGNVDYYEKKLDERLA